MEKNITEEIQKKLSQILTDSYVLCDDDNKIISFAAVRINQNACKVKKLLERYT